jgi:hypothetical protein
MNPSRSMSRSPHEEKPATQSIQTTICRVSRFVPRQETYLAQTHIHKTEASGNDAHKNAVATWTEVKALHKQQNSLIQSNTQTIWTYGLQLWATTSTSDIDILEHSQSKVLHTNVDGPWYVSNTVIPKDLQTPTAKEEICHYSSQYSARISAHPNDLAVNFMAQPDNRRLLRHMPNDLPN